MRKLKLQMNLSLNGLVTVDHGATNFNWDHDLRRFSINNLTQVDTLVLGRNTAEEFIPYWTEVANKPTHPDYSFGKLLTDIPKVVLSNKLKTSKWDNTTLLNGELVKAIQQLKAKSGKDLLVYGGAGVVSALIQNGLVDEYYLLVNPFAVGNGLTIFGALQDRLLLTLQHCDVSASGALMLHYKPEK